MSKRNIMNYIKKQKIKLMVTTTMIVNHIKKQKIKFLITTADIRWTLQHPISKIKMWNQTVTVKKNESIQSAMDRAYKEDKRYLHIPAGTWQVVNGEWHYVK